MRRGLIAVHRWLGVALSVNFFVWFASGIGMMYWDFPGVSGADRLNRMIPLDAAAIRVSLADAFSAASLTTAAEVQLESFDGRPVYRFRGGRSQKVIYADTGEPRASISKEQVDRIAAAWVGRQVSNATIRALDAVDQWTVQLPLARLKPLWQYSWPEGEQIYVSQTTGEVVQYTTRASRLGAWVGAIPHWLYVTPLRQHGQLWSRIVIGLSAIGTFVAVLGLTIGLWTFSPSKRYRRQSRPARWPYRGWKWWHAVFGLSVGMAAVTWVFSGMLSMDPFPLPGDPPHTDAVAETLRGPIDPSAFQSSSPIDAFAAVRPASVKRLDFVSSASRSFYLMTLDSGETRLVDRAGRPSERLQVEDIEQLVTRAIEPDAIVEIRLLDQYDRYYIDRHYSRPLPVVLVRVGRSRCDAVLHRSENRAAGRRVQRQELGDPLAVSRASLAGLPVALSLSTAVGRDCRRIHGGWDGVVLHVARPRLAGDRPNTQPSTGAR